MDQNSRRNFTVVSEQENVRQVSWSEFIEQVRTGPVRSEPSGNVIPNRVFYRGHAKPEWRLWSPFDRRLAMWIETENGGEYWNGRQARGLSWYDTECSSILDKFKRACRGLVGTDHMTTDDEFWALGRHFGLLTPLLDWTRSPYVAAFFAFAERLALLEHGARYSWQQGDRGSVRVWELALWGVIEVPGEFEIVHTAPRAGSRQSAQSGVFTRLRSLEHLELQPYLASRGLGQCLVGYDIPFIDAVHALRDLELMNITPATLFPDLNGAAWQANMDSAALRSASLMHDIISRREQ